MTPKQQATVEDIRQNPRRYPTVEQISAREPHPNCYKLAEQRGLRFDELKEAIVAASKRLTVHQEKILEDIRKSPELYANADLEKMSAYNSIPVELLAEAAGRKLAAPGPVTVVPLPVTEPQPTHLSLARSDPNEQGLNAEEQASVARVVAELSASFPTGVVGEIAPFALRHRDLCVEECRYPNAIVVLRPLETDEASIVARLIANITRSARVEAWTPLDDQILAAIAQDRTLAVRALMRRFKVGYERVTEIATAGGWSFRDGLWRLETLRRTPKSD
jgi:hypothetical protein